VIVEQTQKSGKIFKLPIAIDVYTAGNKERFHVVLENAKDTFYFKTSTKPELINVDAEKILLAEKTDNKSEENYIAQWKYAKNYMDRKEALDFFAKKSMPEIAKGLHDKFSKLKIYTIQKIAATPYKTDAVVLSDIEEMAKKDNNTKVKAAAINFLVKNGDAKYLPIYQAAVNDSSYSVAGAAFKGLAALDTASVYALAKKFSSDAKGALGDQVNTALLNKGTEADFEFIAKLYDEAPLSQEKVGMTSKFAEYLTRVNDISKIKTGVDYMMRFRNVIPEQFRSFVDPTFKSAFDKLSKAKGAEVEAYIKTVFK
jgi:aminopeptidase N